MWLTWLLALLTLKVPVLFRTQGAPNQPHHHESLKARS